MNPFLKKTCALPLEPIKMNIRIIGIEQELRKRLKIQPIF
jgi:hypothetical protein